MHPGLGLDPPSYTLLAGMLAMLAERVGAEAADATAAGRSWGVEAGRRTSSKSCVKALFGEMDRLGFDPEREVLPGGATDIAFLHCPFRELAEAYPELVCNLHRGICEGVVFVGRRGKSRGVRDVVRPRPVPGHRFRRSILTPVRIKRSRRPR